MLAVQEGLELGLKDRGCGDEKTRKSTNWRMVGDGWWVVVVVVSVAFACQ